jgi:hypothetical protein
MSAIWFDPLARCHRDRRGYEVLLFPRPSADRMSQYTILASNRSQKQKDRLHRVMLYDTESAIAEHYFGNVKLTNNDAIPSTGRFDNWPLSIKNITSANISLNLSGVVVVVVVIE